MVGVGTQNALLHTGDQRFINLIGEYSHVSLRNVHHIIHPHFRETDNQCVMAKIIHDVNGK